MQENLTVNDVLESRQEGFGFRISHIIAIWHELIQAAVPLVNVSSGGSFHKHQKLEGHFE
jgi:hypothetical protein